MNWLVAPLSRPNRCDWCDQIDPRMPSHERWTKCQTINMSYCSWPVGPKRIVFLGEWKCAVSFIGKWLPGTCTLSAHSIRQCRPVAFVLLPTQQLVDYIATEGIASSTVRLDIELEILAAAYAHRAPLGIDQCSVCLDVRWNHKKLNNFLAHRNQTVPDAC